MDDFSKALVAAVIGGLMVMAGQYLQDRRKAAAEKKNKKAEKLEELSALLYDASFHIDLFEGQLKSGQSWDAVLQKLPPHPFSRIVAISNVYFPEFQELVDNLMKLSGDYLISVSNKQKEDIDALHEQVGNAWNDVARAVRGHAKREFQ